MSVLRIVGQIYCLAPTPEDIPTLVEIDQKALGGMWSAAGYRRELDSPNSCLRIILHERESLTSPLDRLAPGGMAAERQEVLGLGCYWAILDEAHITLLGIDPGYQRRGLGQWLLLNLLIEACQHQLTRATLEVRPSNSRAVALYQSLGFEALGTRRRYYPDGEDALIFGRIP
ncbi:MAG: ribosomal protein S18-alanine N-acetyltransferase [Leptolyngbyaceae cyanobacterium SM2_3_12]|nr:ribosomal protein S18-alanine N-acetyltransferase [Leptolyngbyaceae cyanobacterium SM2_3_12]